MILKSYIKICVVFAVIFASVGAISNPMYAFLLRAVQGKINEIVEGLDQNNTCVQYLFKVAGAVQKKELWALRSKTVFMLISFLIKTKTVVKRS